MAELTESKVRVIAREEATKVSAALVTKVEELETSIKQNTEILQRLDRLLLGELGVESEDTLKARASYAYKYAKRNTELRIVERAIPALQWFEDWNKIDPGCKESKLSSLGRLIGLFGKIEWLLAIFGITTVANLVIVGKMVFDFFASR